MKPNNNGTTAMAILQSVVPTPTVAATAEPGAISEI